MKNEELVEHDNQNNLFGLCQIPQPFLSFLKSNDGQSCVFSFGTQNNKFTALETIYIDGSVKNFGTGCAIIPFDEGIVERHYLFFSFADAIAFSIMYPKKVIRSILYILGKSPSVSTLEAFIPKRYLRRRVTLCFPKTEYGALQDIKVATELYDQETYFVVIGQNLEILYNNSRFTLDRLSLSLSSFRKKSGFRSAVKTAKTSTNRSFFEELICSTNI